MADWIQRLNRVQSKQMPIMGESVEHLSLEELKTSVMTFGKAHLGKEFETIWSEDPSWVKWFLNHYKSSGKTEHKKMIRFIQLRIEEEENRDQITQAPCATSKSKALPKSLAKAKSQPEPPMIWQMVEGPEMEELIYEPPWQESEMKEVQSEVQVINNRLLGLENAMQHMITLLSQQNKTEGPMTTMSQLANSMSGSETAWDQ